jgi:signal transduction histidine kinase
MNTGSLRLRTLVAVLSVLLLAVLGFAAAITVSYRDGLEGELRAHLQDGAMSLRKASVDQIKPLISSLALEGIDVRLHGAPPQPGKVPGFRARRTSPAVPPTKPRAIVSNGQLLSLTAPLGTGPPDATATLTASRANVDHAVWRLIVTELVGAAVVLTLAVLLSLIALRSALAPLAHISAVARRIASGDLSHRLRPRRPDTELGRMAASFDAMVDSLEQTATRAQRSEATTRRFLADASHELRTPIAASQATAETLLREQPERPRRDRLEAQLARETRRIGKLVNDLLSLARLDAKEPLRTEPIDLTRITRSLIADAQWRAKPARIRLARHGRKIVLGDPEALARALRNLLDNAVAANAEHDGGVHVEVSGSPNSVTASISDNGRGVPADQRERIFEGFARLPTATHEGFGLGLPIARRIARQHDGEITCDETTRGALFTLRLPAAPSTQEA